MALMQSQVWDGASRHQAGAVLEAFLHLQSEMSAAAEPGGLNKVGNLRLRLLSAPRVSFHLTQTAESLRDPKLSVMKLCAQGYQIQFTQNIPLSVPLSAVGTCRTLSSGSAVAHGVLGRERRWQEVLCVSRPSPALSGSLGPGVSSVSSSCRVWSWPSSSSNLPFLPQILFTVLSKLFPPNCEDFTTSEVLAYLSLPGLTVC